MTFAYQINKQFNKMQFNTFSFTIQHQYVAPKKTSDLHVWSNINPPNEGFSTIRQHI